MRVRIKMFDVRTRHILLISLLLLGVFFLWQVVGSPVTISITLGEKKHVEAAGEPLTIDAPVTFTSTNNLTVPKVIDAANSAYFLDPAATGDSLVAAGKLTAASFAGDGSLLTGISGIPAGLVSFFNLASCPSGWTELTAARGMTMVGLPAAGTLAGTVGTGFTNLENRTHTHTGPSHTHNQNIGAGNDGIQGYKIVASSASGANLYQASAGSGYLSILTGVSDSGSGATGTATTSNVIPYIQLLVCQKS